MTRLARRLLAASWISLLAAGLCSADVSAQRNVGACCFRDGSCNITTAEECSAKGGTFLGLNTSCDACTPQCNDGNPCTVDHWDGMRCVYTPMDCDDDDPCTVDSCIMGRCRHEPIACDDGNPCTTDVCVSGECAHLQILCSDGDPCTTDSCVGGDCVYAPLDCDDDDPCTTDVCVSGECAHLQILCSDGDPCTTDSCVEGDCVYAPLDCDDDDPCTTDVCVSGECAHLQILCSDGDPCTTDSCVGGDCVYLPLNCDDDNPTTADACVDGGCRHTPIDEPSFDSDAAVSPIVWYLDEGPWGENEIKLHAALCAGAARSAVQFRALMYEDGQIREIEKLLSRLPDGNKPDLILCSRKTIREIHPSVAEGIHFFDTDVLGQHAGEGGRVGIAGPRADWVSPDADVEAPLVGLQTLGDGLWNLAMLPDPLDALEALVAARAEAIQAAGSTSDEVHAIEELILPGIPCCRIAAVLSGADGWSTGLFEACCAGEGLDLGDAGTRLVVPTREAAMPEGAQAEGDARPESWTVRWLLRTHAADLERDETWQRVKSGLHLEEGEQVLIDAFRQWLSINGHVDAAERIGDRQPLSEDINGYAARYVWFRESLKQALPTELPWWLLWAPESAMESVGARSIPSADQALLIISRLDPDSGELIIDFLED